MFKHEIDSKRFFFLHPLIAMVLMDVKYWAITNGVPFNITETVTTMDQDEKVNRVHKTHRTGRAFDLSIKGWDEINIKDCVKHFNEKYKDIAAYSSSSNKPILVVDHVGTARHLHFQINAKYSLNIESLPLQ